MKISEAREKLQPIKNEAEKSGDKYCFVYFSASDDEYSGGWNMDKGDALIVIEEMIKEFGFDRAALIAMSE